jgi:hypothetical protein
VQRYSIELLQGMDVFGEKFADLSGLGEDNSQTDNCFFFFYFGKTVVLSEFRQQDVVDCDIFEEKSA